MGAPALADLSRLRWIGRVAVWPSHSADIEKNNRHLWTSMNRSSLHQHRTVLIDSLADHEARGTLERYGKGRGIVFTAGNADTLMRVIYTLRMLRNGE